MVGSRMNTMGRLLQLVSRVQTVTLKDSTGQSVSDASRTRENEASRSLHILNEQIPPRSFPLSSALPA